MRTPNCTTTADIRDMSEFSVQGMPIRGFPAMLTDVTTSSDPYQLLQTWWPR